MQDKVEPGDFRRQGAVDWPTLLLICGCYGAWLLALFWLAKISTLLAVPVLILALVLHSSLQHEVLHGHPFRIRLLNEALVFLPIGLVYPYGRFRDLHLAHHRDEFLTDPYDDPESNFQDPAVWAHLSPWHRALLRFNNTLAGRMLVGPVIGTVAFVASDFRAIREGDRAVLRDWLLHVAGLVVVVLIVRQGALSGWAYLASAYMALSVLKIRTFLEHRAHDLARGRTVVVEGGLILPFLFLNNNLHVVHHARPAVAWYKLPRLYREGQADYLRRNDGYRYSSYAEVFRLYFLKAKDPVPHPIWPVRRR